MPQLGEVRNAKEAGFKGWAKRVWSACEKCGKERWVILKVGGQPKSKMCRKCCGSLILGRAIGEKHGLWKGGKWISQGYIMVKLYPNDPFYPMAIKPHQYVLEHRLVMAKHLGRCLKSWEVIHHKNHIKTDNRVENLQLISRHRHMQVTIMEDRINSLEQQVATLEAENLKLREAQ